MVVGMSMGMGGSGGGEQRALSDIGFRVITPITPGMILNDTQECEIMKSEQQKS